LRSADAFFQDEVPFPKPLVDEDRCRADGGMPRKGELRLGREDPDARRVARVARRQDERRLGEIELARERLHRRLRDARGVGEYRQLVARERPVGEDVCDDETLAHAIA
jgi:hypothetical protein